MNANQCIVHVMQDFLLLPIDSFVILFEDM